MKKFILVSLFIQLSLSGFTQYKQVYYYDVMSDSYTYNMIEGVFTTNSNEKLIFRGNKICGSSNNCDRLVSGRYVHSQITYNFPNVVFLSIENTFIPYSVLPNIDVSLSTLYNICSKGNYENIQNRNKKYILTKKDFNPIDTGGGFLSKELNKKTGNNTKLLSPAIRIAIYPFYDFSLEKDSLLPRNIICEGESLKINIGKFEFYLGTIRMKILVEGNSKWINYQHSVTKEILEIKYSELPIPLGEDWYNKELSFKLVNPTNDLSDVNIGFDFLKLPIDKTEKNSTSLEFYNNIFIKDVGISIDSNVDLTTLENNIISGIFFIETPKLKIDSIPITCHGGTGGFIISNIPDNPTGKLRVNVIRLSDKSSEKDPKSDDYRKINGKEYYWKDAITITYPLENEQLGNSIRFENQKPGTFIIQAFYDNGGNKESSLCGIESQVFTLKDIEKLTLEIPKADTLGSDKKSYYIKKAGGSFLFEKSFIKGMIDDRTYTYRYKKLHNGVKDSANISFDGTDNKLTAGKYKLLVTDNGCTEYYPTEFILNEPKVLVCKDTVYQPLCNVNSPSTKILNSSKGIVSVKVISGGISPYTLNLSNGSDYKKTTIGFSANISTSLADLAPGKYELEITDAGEGVYSNTINIDKAPKAISISKTSVSAFSCENSNSVEFEIEGGSLEPNSVYTIESSIIDLPSGENEAIILDDKGCTLTHIYNIPKLSAIQLQTEAPFKSTDANENSYYINKNGGTYSLDILSMTNNRDDCTYSYTYSTSRFDETSFKKKIFSSDKDNLLAEGYYSFYVSESATCNYKVGSVHINHPEIVDIETLILQPACDAKNTTETLKTQGQISFSIAGGIPSYTATLEKGEETHELSTSKGNLLVHNIIKEEGNYVFEELEPGEYSLIINDQVGEIYNMLIRINAPEPIIISDTPIVTNTSCYGANDGSVQLDITGGRENYTTAPAPLNLAAGNYTFTITDENQCVATSNLITIKEPESIEIIKTSSTNEICKLKGSLTFKIKGGWTNKARKLVLSSAKKLSTSIETDIPIGSSEFTHTFTELKASDDYIISIVYDEARYNDCNNSIYNIEILYINPLDNLSFTSLKDESCEGKSNAEIQLNGINNIIGDYNEGKYTISDISAYDPETGIITNLSSGSYSFIIAETEGRQCSKMIKQEVTLIENALSLSNSSTVVSCKEISNGTITLSAINGVPSSDDKYDYYLTDVAAKVTIKQNATIALFDKRLAGNYIAYVEDSQGCKTADTLMVVGVIDTPLKIKKTLATNPSCRNTNTGKIIAQLQGGSDNMSYVLTNALDDTEYSGELDASNEIRNIAAGVYDLTITATDACSSTYPGILLSDPEEIEIISSKKNIIKEKGAATGFFKIELKGGNNSYNYTWQNTDPSSKIESETVSFKNPDKSITIQKKDLKAGEYEFKLQDSAKCRYFDNKIWYTKKINIIEPELELQFASKEVTDATCFKYADGKINVKAKGGWGKGYSYSIDSKNWKTDGFFEDLSKGEYSLWIKDKENIIRKWSTNIDYPDSLSIKVKNTKKARCPNDNSGIVKADVVNGISKLAGFRYSILRNGSDIVYEGNAEKNFIYKKLKAGAFTLKVEDGNKCIATDTFTITEPEVPIIKIHENFIKAKNENTGEIQVEITGGNAKFDYIWYKGDNTDIIEKGKCDSSILLENLYAGKYTLLVRDTALCVYQVSKDKSAWMKHQIDIIEPDKALSFHVNENIPVSCFSGTDGKINIEASGGWGNYIYSIPGTEPNTDGEFLNLKKNTYQLSVTDSENVVFTKAIDVVQPDILVAKYLHSKDINCWGGDDGEIELKVEGGNHKYFVSIDNTNWIAGQSLDGLKAGTYTVIAKDTNNCQSQVDNIVLKQASKLNSLESKIILSKCENNEGAIYASFKGGLGSYTYSWSKINPSDKIKTDLPQFKSANITGLYSSEYTVIVRDENNCEFTQHFNVGDNSSFNITRIDTKPVSCWGYSDGSAIATIKGGNFPYYYSWSEAIDDVDNNNANNIAAGHHNLFVEDSKGCKDNKGFNIVSPDKLSYDTLSFSHPLCRGGLLGNINIRAKGGVGEYEYLWNDNSSQTERNKLMPGEYILNISDGNTCKSSFPIIMKYQRTLKPYLGNDTIICHYNTLPVDAGEYKKYSWSSKNKFTSNKRIVKLSQASEYYLKVSDNDACIGNDTLRLEVDDFKISRFGKTDVTCNAFADGLAWLEVEPKNQKHTIKWTNGSTNERWNNISGGDYSVNVADKFGCVDKRDFVIYEPKPLDVTIRRELAPFCLGVPDGEISVEAHGGNSNYNYAWNTGKQKAKISHLDKGIYKLNISDSKNCMLYREFKLDYQNTIFPDLGNDINLCSNNTVKLYPGEYDKYKWVNQEKETISIDTAIIVSLSGKYAIEVSDEDSCIGRDTISVSSINSSLIPQFLVASSVAVGDTLIMIEISNPKPDVVEWNINKTHKITEEGDYFTKIVFSEIGVAEIVLNAHHNKCIGQARSLVLITPKSEENNENKQVQENNTIIKTMLVSPNPSKGKFIVETKLNQTANVSFYIVELSIGQIIEKRKRNGLNHYTETFELSKAGVYAIFLEVKGERRCVKLIVL